MSEPEPMDDFDTIAKKYHKVPVTFGVMAGHLKQIIKGTGEAVRGLRNNDAALDARLTALETRATKSVGGVCWAGIYEPGRVYRSGELVTKTGLWLCIAPSTTAAPGSDPTSWKLVVNRKLVPTE